MVDTRTNTRVTGMIIGIVRVMGTGVRTRTSSGRGESVFARSFVGRTDLRYPSRGVIVVRPPRAQRNH